MSVVFRAVLVAAALASSAVGIMGVAEAAQPSPGYAQAERVGTVRTGATPNSVPVTTVAHLPATTTPPVESNGGEGSLGLLVHAKSAFDGWTRPTDPEHWEGMRAAYDSMIVYPPYFDSRVDLFPDAFAYRDLYAAKVRSATDRRVVDHPDWVLRTASGEPVYIPFGCSGSSGCPQYALDLGHPGVQDDFLAVVADYVGRGYSGIMIDDVNMLWRFSDRDGSTVRPMNPRTAEELTLPEWQAAVAHLVERVRQEFPGIDIMHNSVWYAALPSTVNPEIDRQIAAADFIMMERGATDAGLVGGNGRFSYALWMEYIDRVHELGTNVLLLDQSAKTVAEQTFNLASGLLVSNGMDLVSTQQYEVISPRSIWSGFDTDLGDALGPRERDGSLWRRDFTGGLVIVNEPGFADHLVELGGEFRRLDGSVVERVLLSPREAVVLTPVDGER